MNYKTALNVVIFCALVGISYASVADTCTGTNAITNITNTSPSGDYEYVEFTINNPTPTYDVTSVSPPFVTVSEKRIKVSGKQFKQIVFQNVEWMCSIKTALSLPKKQVKDLKFTDQSEGVVAMVIGYQDGKSYITTEQQTAGAVTKVIMKFKKNRANSARR
jgi:hypothetical protein